MFEKCVCVRMHTCDCVFIKLLYKFIQKSNAATGGQNQKTQKTVIILLSYVTIN